MKLAQLLFGARRRVLTGKDGNKNFYKGRGVRNPGFHTKWGGYKFVPKKIPIYHVPDLTDCELKPYVSYRVPEGTEPEMTGERLLEQIKSNIDIIQYKEVP